MNNLFFVGACLAVGSACAWPVLLASHARTLRAMAIRGIILGCVVMVVALLAG